MCMGGVTDFKTRRIRISCSCEPLFKRLLLHILAAVAAFRTCVCAMFSNLTRLRDLHRDDQRTHLVPVSGDP